MKQRIGYLLRFFGLILLFFLAAKTVFVLYNTNEADSPLALSQLPSVLWNGLSMDVSTTCYLLAVPYLIVLVSLFVPRLPLRAILLPYTGVVAFLISAIAVIDTSLYPFWQFKIDATIFAYIDSPAEALASVSTGFVVLRTLITLLLTGVLTYVVSLFTPTQGFAPFSSARTKCYGTLTALFIGGLIFLGIRGGVNESTMNVGRAYFSPTPFLNHAAVNPAFSLLSSSLKSEDFGAKYNYFDESVRATQYNRLYPTDTSDITDTLLVNNRPNVLFIILEGYGTAILDALGNEARLKQIAADGIYFDNLYANSFRTDRGLVSILSGHISYPVNTLMKLPAKQQNLPSIARMLNASGYRSDFIYGGDADFTNMRGYLIGMGYETVSGMEDYPIKQRTSSAWGVADEYVFDRTLQHIKALPTDRPWHTCLLTLSSHEPYDVPYHKLDDEVLNAFAYTDECLSNFLSAFKDTPQWKNTLVVILPDHGFKYANLQISDPAFFHVPMVWTGGAIRSPRTIATLMSQSDVAATVLAQLCLPVSDFAYSRNIFSRQYTYPFAYATYSDAFLFADSTGVTIYDNVARHAIVSYPEQGSQERELNGKALLQTSYDHLEAGRYTNLKQ